MVQEGKEERDVPLKITIWFVANELDPVPPPLTGMVPVKEIKTVLLVGHPPGGASVKILPKPAKFMVPPVGQALFGELVLKVIGFAAIVIDPGAFVIEMPAPAVSVLGV